MRKKLLSVISALAASCTIFFMSNVVSSATLQERLCGNDRYQTNSKIVDSGWTSAEYAVIASGEGFADALCAAPLAEQNKAPILLTSKDSLNADSKNQLSKLKVKKVFIIGGTSVVSDNVKSEIEDLGINTTRIYGQNRFETSVEVAKNLKNINGVVVTNGYGFADALSIAPVTAQKGMPILLTDKDDLSSPVKNFLANSSYDKSYIVGGNGVVSDKVASQLKDNRRLGGISRYDTNSSVLNQFADEFNYDKVYVASGENYSDALSGSVLAASSSSPLILVGTSVDPSVISSIKAQHEKYNNVIVLGGTGVVSDTLANNIVSGAFIPSTSDDSIVAFKDKNLEQAVRDTLNKSTGVIYKSDVEKITELNVDGHQIQDLSGIENLTKLQQFSLIGNNVSDISRLNGLSNLKGLDLLGNDISDISPLKKLFNLQKLNLGNNKISDISALEGLTNLQDLGMYKDNLDNIGVLKGLTNLQKLDLSYNEISDISVLEALTNLQDLNIEGDNLGDISVLKGLTHLQKLDLGTNKISNISALEALTNLQNLNIEGDNLNDISSLKGLTNLQKLNLRFNKISDISVLEALTNLQDLNMYGNDLGDISALKGLTNLQKLDLSYNNISDVSALEALTNLQNLYIYQNKITNISALKGLTNLQELNLSYNSITNINPLKGLSNLKILNLDEISDADKQSLKDSLPKCTIKYPVCVEKPNIYLYPDKTETLSVYVNPKGTITKSIPEYNQGWKVNVDSSGKIDNKYNFLFYEVLVNYQFTLNKGWIVNKDSFNKEMNNILTSIGLNSKEKADFIEYWSKRLNWQSSRYAAYYLDPKEINEAIKLNLSNEPDSILRAYFYFVPLNDNKNLEIRNPEIEEFKRNGFTVVEWGGICK